MRSRGRNSMVPSVPTVRPSIDSRTSPARQDSRRRGPDHRLQHQHAGPRRRQRVAAAQVGCLEPLPAERDRGHAVVASVRDIGEEVVHHRNRNHVGDVVGADRGLHRHAHHLPLREDRSAAVARVHRAVDLTGEELAAVVDVDLMLDAGHHAPGDAQRVASDGEAENQDLLPKLGQAAQAQRREGVEEAGLVDGQDSEVGVVGDVEHPRGESLRLAVPPHLDECRVAHHVGIGQDPTTRDDEPGAADRARGRRSPRRSVVRDELGRVDLEDGVRGLARGDHGGAGRGGDRGGASEDHLCEERRVCTHVGLPVGGITEHVPFHAARPSADLPQAAGAAGFAARSASRRTGAAREPLPAGGRRLRSRCRTVDSGQGDRSSMASDRSGSAATGRYSSMMRASGNSPQRARDRRQFHDGTETQPRQTSRLPPTMAARSCTRTGRARHAQPIGSVQKQRHRCRRLPEGAGARDGRPRVLPAGALRVERRMPRSPSSCARSTASATCRSSRADGAWRRLAVKTRRSERNLSVRHGPALRAGPRALDPDPACLRAQVHPGDVVKGEREAQRVVERASLRLTKECWRGETGFAR